MFSKKRYTCIDDGWVVDSSGRNGDRLRFHNIQTFFLIFGRMFIEDNIETTIFGWILGGDMEKDFRFVGKNDELS